MPPVIATVIFAVGIAGLFVLDSDHRDKVSNALWVPVVWLLINGSRAVTLWLGLQSQVKLQNADQYLDGSPVDRWIYTALILAGLLVLAARKNRVARMLRNNPAIVLFFSYCGISVLWSDYLDVSAKRWIKAVGDLVMVLIVLTDSKPFAAAKRLLARVGFVLIPASILLIKYYPALGRVYNIWTWQPMFVGVTDHKNTLGMICMVLGLGFEWRFLVAYRDRAEKLRTKRLIVYGVLLAMVVWLFVQADSVTSSSCFLLGTIFLLAHNLPAFTRKRWRTYALMAMLVIIPFAILFMGIGESALQGIGRDATLTGRTDMWKDVLSMSGNPLLGTGFESFWLGTRADRMWKIFYFHPTQAHNGYIELYLELGWIGLALMGAVIVTGCRNAVATFRWDPDTAKIRLSYIVVGLAYNMTEAGFKMLSLTWFFFLMSAVVIPKPQVRDKAYPGRLKRFRTEIQPEPEPEHNAVTDFAKRRLETI